MFFKLAELFGPLIIIGAIAVFLYWLLNRQSFYRVLRSFRYRGDDPIDEQPPADPKP